jgi:hypothetical protein
MRILPHEDAINEKSYAEIPDYEKAKAIIEDSNKCWKI